MKKKLTLNKKGLLVVIALIMLAQCVVMVYWQRQRGNYHVDELYSFGYGKAFVQDAPPRYINDSDVWKTNEWVERNDLASELIVTKEDSLFSQPFFRSVRLMAGKRTYFGFLNMVMSAADPFKGYYRGGFALNLVFFILSEIILWRCMKILTGSNGISLLSICMFGFSSIIIGMCGFIRFYMFAIMLMLIVVLCHIKMWTEERRYKFLIYEAGAFVASYFGARHSEFMLIVCGAFFYCFLVGLLCRKKYLNVIVYILPLVIGTVMLVQQSEIIRIVFHLSDYAKQITNSNYMAAYNLLHPEPVRVTYSIRVVRSCLIDLWFGHWGALLAFALIFFALLISWLVRKNSREESENGEGRYLGLVIIMALSAAAGILFNILADLTWDRYQTFIMVMLMVVFWYCAAALYRTLKDKRILIVFFALTVVSSVLCQKAANFPYLLTADKRDVEKIEQYKDLDHVVYENYNQNGTVYDCIVHCAKDRKICITELPSSGSIKKTNPPKQFIMWCPREEGIGKIIPALQETDYTYSQIGSTYMSCVYLCTKKP